jgi:hypothetical protein
VTLDPRTKSLSYCSQDEKNFYEKLGEDFYLKNYSGNSNKITPKQTPSKRTNCVFSQLMTQFYQKERGNSSDSISEFGNFLKKAENFQDDFTTVLDWWSSKEMLYPNLSLMIRDFLAVQASSAPCERLFSSAGNFLTKKRNRLKANSITQSICLNNWLSLFESI